MVVIPLLLDLHDFQDVMRNISVPIRLLVLVQNGREPQLSSFLDEVEGAYGWSGRLVVRRCPENIGYSGAVSFGLRLAMSLPREKMPFVFVTNSDVTLSPDLLPRLLHDAARMDELAAEVADETSSCWLFCQHYWLLWEKKKKRYPACGEGADHAARLRAPLGWSCTVSACTERSWTALRLKRRTASGSACPGSCLCGWSSLRGRREICVCAVEASLHQRLKDPVALQLFPVDFSMKADTDVMDALLCTENLYFRDSVFCGTRRRVKCAGLM
ncbi:beta galactofuranosyl glycosyltransferase [Trypanosoma grayi]|uniref:beta galactofuranosyl glycosyltransferase n=1 Tax=Trypanosoma grayi TaxID=71804 RepID=UPI0004F3F3FA|nr:beta galactofuranosyl glycosyltransferase [Trypanosoma grayi]KEG15402.1 beta galactofuranosyl glycosyltransferase [Trypanosoma grayi]